jgi:hypothetical protein
MVMTPFCPLVAGQRTLKGSHHRTLFTAELKRYLAARRTLAPSIERPRKTIENMMVTQLV